MSVKMPALILSGTALVLVVLWFVSDPVFRWVAMDAQPDLHMTAGQIEAAEAEARRRWPEFVRAFEAGDGSHRFQVQTRIEREGESEMLWLNVEAIDGPMLHCTIDEPPATIYSLEVHDAVLIPADEVRDWSFLTTDGHSVSGGVSGVLMKRLQR